MFFFYFKWQEIKPAYFFGYWCNRIKLISVENIGKWAHKKQFLRRINIDFENFW